MRDLILTIAFLFTLTNSVQAKPLRVDHPIPPIIVVPNNISYSTVKDTTVQTVGEKSEIESINITLNKNSCTVTLEGKVLLKELPTYVSVSATAENTKEALKVAYRSFQKLNKM